MIKTDSSWNKIYKKGLHLNEYPYEWVVGNTKKIFPNPKKKNVLDLGCGAGNHLQFFLNHNFNFITAIDGSKNIIKFTKKKFKNSKKIEFINKNILINKFRSNFYDLILDRMTITHNDKKDINNLANNLYLSLKKNGYLFSICFSKKHNEYNRFKDKGIFFKNVNKDGGIKSSFLDSKEIKNIYKKFKIISIIEEVKTDIVSKEKYAAWYLILKK